MSCVTSLGGDKGGTLYPQEEELSFARSGVSHVFSFRLSALSVHLLSCAVHALAPAGKDYPREAAPLFRITSEHTFRRPLAQALATSCALADWQTALMRWRY